ncbi:MAG: hypothetical protein Q9190_005965 [Brigantiaea leucoxantha]
MHQPIYHPVDDFSWETFLKTGSVLAKDIAQLATEFPRRPIIFIAHSLGGALVKKALLLAHQNLQDPRFKLVVDCLSGILFLGTPHAGLSDEDTLHRHNQVLFNFAKAAAQKQSQKPSRSDVYRLATLSATFEQIANIPILTVFEYADQRSSMHKFFGKRSKSVLDSVDKQLLPRETQGLVNVQDIRLFALCGMGGIGKTDLAAEYAYSRRHRYGAIFWLEAAGVSQLASDFGRISVQLGLESPNEAKDLEASIEIAKAWLTKPRSTEDGENDSWLLIFDNADNLDIITNYIPHNGSGSILVTSRDPFAKEQYSSNGTGIDLEPLPMNESATLLRKLVTRSEVAKNADEQDASIDLAKQLDGLPLAMTQIAGFIRRRRLLIREFANLYATDARYAEMHHVSNLVQDHRYGHTLATAYNFRDLKTPAWRLLQLLAFMNADRIREDIFFNHELANDQDSTSWTASTFENARYELLASSIIKRNIDKKELWIHRVIQTEVRTSIDTDHLYQNFRDVVTLLAQLWPPGDLCSQVGKRWALCEDLMPHLERLYQLYVEYSKSWFDFEIDLAFPTLLNEAAV